MERALFVPLTGRWYDLIASGEKTHEYRRAGGRWTVEKVEGRDAVLSRGYGKRCRMRVRIASARIVNSTGTDADLVYGPGVQVLEMEIAQT